MFERNGGLSAPMLKSVSVSKNHLKERLSRHCLDGRKRPKIVLEDDDEFLLRVYALDGSKVLVAKNPIVIQQKI